MSHLEALDNAAVVSVDLHGGVPPALAGSDPVLCVLHHHLRLVEERVHLTVQIHRDGNPSVLGCKPHSQCIACLNADDITNYTQGFLPLTNLVNIIYIHVHSYNGKCNLVNSYNSCTFILSYVLSF